MNFLLWVASGVFVGLVANVIDYRNSDGPTNYLIAITGALIGGFLSVLFIGLNLGDFNPLTLILALISSSIVLYCQKTLQSN